VNDDKPLRISTMIGCTVAMTQEITIEIRSYRKTKLLVAEVLKMIKKMYDNPTNHFHESSRQI
jgi:hypothetical protein